MTLLFFTCFRSPAACSLTVCIVLNQQIYSYYRDPKGENIFSQTVKSSEKSGEEDGQQRVALSLADLSDSERVNVLTARVKTLEDIIKMKLYDPPT